MNSRIVRIDPELGVETLLHGDPTAGIPLRQAYELIGCEVVELLRLNLHTGEEPIFDGEPCQMLIDEEGKLKPHTINPYATGAAHQMGMIPRDDYIAGTALLLFGDARWLAGRD